MVRDCCGSARWLAGFASPAAQRMQLLALAEMREELRSLRSLVAAGQPLGGRRSSDSHSESAMEISAALARPAAQTARGTRAPSRSPPPVAPEGRRRGGDRNSHRRKSISVLSRPAAAGIIE